MNLKSPQGNGSAAPPSTASHEQRPHIGATVGLYIAWLIAAAMLVSAAAERHPYSFYTLLRWICCPIFAYSAFAAHEKNRVLWVWVFGALAALYNPILLVHLDRRTWISVNWFTVGAIIVAAVTFLRRRARIAVAVVIGLAVTTVGLWQLQPLIRSQASVSSASPQRFEPATQSVSQRYYPWRTNIVTTVFWIGGPKETDDSTRTASAWDFNWLQNYGGVDSPEASARRNYIPIDFIPGQNPFYCALPYNDVIHGQFKPEASLAIPWFKHEYRGPGQSVCRDRWIAIRKGNRTCYAQWEDCGPFRTDHFQYVFGNERPTPNPNHGAGLDVSPAVRDYLGLAPTDVIDWQFVEVRDVPPGPWRSYGENNHFVIARRQNEQRMEQNDQSPKN